jgi:predicted alpha/beta hydrolase family esterase
MPTFTQPPYDWRRILQHADSFHVLYSDNDPYISIQLSENLGKNLGVTPVLVPGAGHFNSSAGYDKFPLLLGNVLAETTF